MRPPADLPLLAFDTSTDQMSIAVCRPADGPPRVWRHTAAGGAQASAGLIPAIQSLMAQAGLDFGDLGALAFGCGPGAFTGLRTACAVAQGLAFGARVPPGRAGVVVLPVDTLLALAEEARHQHEALHSGPLRVLALLDARMDEVYAAAYAFDGQSWTTVQGGALCRPEVVPLPPGWQGQEVLVAGNAMAVYGVRLAQFAPGRQVDALPTAAAMLRLAPALLAQGLGVPAAQALPTYIRDKVAQTSSERAAAKAAVPPPSTVA